MSGLWTDEEVELVAGMLRKGMSAGQIAPHMGMSRNAVIGRVDRNPVLKEIGLQGRPLTSMRQREPNSMIARRIQQRRAAPGLSKIAKNLPAPNARLVSLLDLGPTECKWPIGDPHKPGFGFCADARHPGSSYCPYHARLAWVGSVASSESSVGGVHVGNVLRNPVDGKGDAEGRRTTDNVAPGVSGMDGDRPAGMVSV